ncbi:MAG TPA: hypothetical protein VFW96_18600 [Thermomicrobiales bacterium]|nr:hypothetical protein [Thermomicrobiales bacterium]
MSAATTPTSANEFIEQQLNIRLATLEDVFESDALCLVAPMGEPIDDLVRVMVEERRYRPDTRSPNLTVLLTTEGGFAETVQHIVETLRHHYDQVSFVIPRVAYSAGTVLALSGDEIYMDYYARLGPIDPQVATASGRWVPALGYIAKWEELVGKSKAGTLTEAELAVMATFDLAELYYFEQAKKLAIMLVQKWLADYKFKDWTITETRGTPVDRRRRVQRAGQIARALSNPDRWHSHGHGISRIVLDQELQLKVNDLDADPVRLKAVREYDGLLIDYMEKMRYSAMLHIVDRYRPLILG